MKIHVVIGTTGEYSDRSEWPVCAYMNEEDAKAHVVKATEFAKAWELASRDIDDYSERYRRMSVANPMDANFSSDYTGTTYCYESVDLYEKFTVVERPAA